MNIKLTYLGGGIKIVDNVETAEFAYGANKAMLTMINGAVVPYTNIRKVEPLGSDLT